MQGPSVGTRLAPPCAPSHPRMPPHAPFLLPSSQAHHVATCAATSAWGAVAIDEHLARQRGARAMRDARDARCKLADGSGYTGRPTKPRPFVLGQARRPAGPRLHKPPCEARLRGAYESIHSVLHGLPGAGMPGGGMGTSGGPNPIPNPNPKPNPDPDPDPNPNPNPNQAASGLHPCRRRAAGKPAAIRGRGAAAAAARETTPARRCPGRRLQTTAATAAARPLAHRC